MNFFQPSKQWQELSLRSCYPPKTLAFLTKKVNDDLNNYDGLSLLYYFVGLVRA
jgi:hypothetical protein